MLCHRFVQRKEIRITNNIGLQYASGKSLTTRTYWRDTGTWVVSVCTHRTLLTNKNNGPRILNIKYSTNNSRWQSLKCKFLFAAGQLFEIFLCSCIRSSDETFISLASTNQNCKKLPSKSMSNWYYLCLTCRAKVAVDLESDKCIDFCQSVWIESNLSQAKRDQQQISSKKFIGNSRFLLETLTSGTVSSSLLDCHLCSARIIFISFLLDSIRKIMISPSHSQPKDIHRVSFVVTRGWCKLKATVAAVLVATPVSLSVAIVSTDLNHFQPEMWNSVIYERTLFKIWQYKDIVCGPFMA